MIVKYRLRSRTLSKFFGPTTRLKHLHPPALHGFIYIQRHFPANRSYNPNEHDMATKTNAFINHGILKDFGFLTPSRCK